MVRQKITAILIIIPFLSWGEVVYGGNPPQKFDNNAIVSSFKSGNTIRVCIVTAKNTHISKDYGVTVDTIPNERKKWNPSLPITNTDEIGNLVDHFEFDLIFIKQTKSDLKIEIGICNNDLGICIPEVHFLNTNVNSKNLDTNSKCIQN